MVSKRVGLLYERSADVTDSCQQQICAESCAAALRIRQLRWIAQPFLCPPHEKKHPGRVAFVHHAHN